MDAESQISSYYDYYSEYYYNETDHPCTPQRLPYARWILPMLYSVFFVLGLTGNLVVIAVLFKRSSRRADTFILNLAVSDLLFVLTLPLWASSLALGEYWPFGVHLCKASSFTIAVSRCASSLLMAVMSVDRYLAVKKGQKVRPFRTPTCSFGTCCAIWAFSILCGLPALVFRHLDSKSSACVESSSSLVNTGLKMATIILTFVLPFTIVVFCYCGMAKHLWRYFGRQKNSANGSMKRQYGHSWLRIVSCVVAAYSLSWFPFNTLNTVAVVTSLGPDLPCPTSVVIRQALTAVAALAFANSCTNPLIYAVLDAGFRRRARLALPWLFPTCCSFRLLSLRGLSLSSSPRSMDSTSTYTDSTGRQPT
ncbi:putative G-protein coupled receptor 25 [Pelodytes ibericus]